MIEKRPFHRSNQIVLFGLVYLILCYIIIFLVDIINLFGWSDFLSTKDVSGVPLLWFHLFTEASPTEMLQWFSLAACILLCGIHYGLYKATGDERATFFLFIGIGLSIMLVEDAGNFRHRINHYVSFLAGNSRLLRFGVELLIYSALGFVMVYPIIKYWKKLRFNAYKQRLIIGAYLLYASASIASVSRSFWYGDFGERIISGLSLYENPAWNNANVFLESLERPPLGFYLMDFVFEESFELLGAVCFLAFFVSVLSAKNK